MADVLVFAGTPLGDYLLGARRPFARTRCVLTMSPEAMGENAPVLAAVGDHRPEPVVELPPQVPTPRSVINEYFDRVSASGFDMESERVTNARAMKRRCRSLALSIAARDCAIVWSTADCHALVALFAAAVATSSPALSALLFCLLAAYFVRRRHALTPLANLPRSTPASVACWSRRSLMRPSSTRYSTGSTSTHAAARCDLSRRVSLRRTASLSVRRSRASRELTAATAKGDSSSSAKRSDLASAHSVTMWSRWHPLWMLARGPLAAGAFTALVGYFPFFGAVVTVTLEW